MWNVQLQPAESSDVEVTREDQMMINQFSFLNSKMHELIAEAKVKQVVHSSPLSLSHSLLLSFALLLN
jgi:hypothetical protein